MTRNNNQGIILLSKSDNNGTKKVPSRNNLGIVLLNKRDNNNKIERNNSSNKAEKIYFSFADTFSTKRYEKYHRRDNYSNTNYGDRCLLPTNYPSVATMQSFGNTSVNLGAIPF